MRESKRDKLFRSMLQPKPGLEYYAIRVTADEQGRITYGAYTHWVGYTETEPRREIREGSIVRPDIMIESWDSLTIPYWVVSSEEEMFIYLCCGGPALVEKSLGERYFASVIEPNECANDGPLGFKTMYRLPQQAFYRAPRPKLRMAVLKRDQFRCRICGRRPADNIDLELHVHHIRPWATGGLTEAENLISLCHTCHNGLSPHEELGLFDLIGRKTILGNEYTKGIVDGMLCYSALMKQRLEKEVAQLNAEKNLRQKRYRRQHMLSGNQRSKRT